MHFLKHTQTHARQYTNNSDTKRISEWHLTHLSSAYRCVFVPRWFDLRSNLPVWRDVQVGNASELIRSGVMRWIVQRKRRRIKRRKEKQQRMRKKRKEKPGKRMKRKYKKWNWKEGKGFNLTWNRNMYHFTLLMRKRKYSFLFPPDSRLSA